LIYLKVALVLAVVIAGILFGVSNRQDTVIHFFNYATREFPLYLVLFGSFISGAVLSFIYNVISVPDLKDREKRAAGEIKELEKLLSEKQKERAKSDGEASSLAQKH
jgi:uncharacterized integral membrane protein